MNRRGLRRLLSLAQKVAIETLRITDRDRLARFGVDLLQRVPVDYRVQVIVVHETQSHAPQEKLVTDMMALITSFSGRVYGFRAAALRAQ